jgi:glutathione S-transferase
MRWTHPGRGRTVAGMQLYFNPLACSLATRISLDEAGLAATFTEVDARSKRTLPDDGDYLAVHPLGLVPALRTDDGELLTENAAILQYIADLAPPGRLAPPPEQRLARTRLQQWLCFIGTELHKGVFALLFDRSAPDAARAYAVEKSRSRLAHVAAHLTGRDFLLDDFSVADAYLITVLTWTAATPVDLAAFPALTRYAAQLRGRPSVARALAHELPLYRAEQARHAVV